MEPGDFVDRADEFKDIREEAEIEAYLGEGEPKDYVVVGSNAVYDVPRGQRISLTATKAHILLVSGNIIPAEDIILPPVEHVEAPKTDLTKTAVVTPGDSDEADLESDATESE